MTTTTIETLTATALMGEVIATGRAMVRLVASYCCCKLLCIKYIRGVGLYPSEPDVLEPPYDEFRAWALGDSGPLNTHERVTQVGLEPMTYDPCPPGLEAGD